MNLVLVFKVIPRTIVLDKLGKQLVQWPITEVETLRYNQVDFPSQILKGGSRVEITGITNSQVVNFTIFPYVIKISQQLLFDIW